MYRDIDKVLFTEEQIKQRVAEMGAQLTEEYEGKDPLFIGVLKGSFVFVADLVREIKFSTTLNFIALSSYGSGSTSSGRINVNLDIKENIVGRDLIILEDILDTGNTLSFLKKYLLDRGAASVKICTLVDKPARRTADISADYSGFICPNEFIVGYGLDYNEKYRNLPYIGVVEGVE